MPQQLVEKSPRSANSKGLGKVPMTVPSHPMTHFEVRMTVPGHPRSETLVRTPCFFQILFLLVNYKVSVASLL